MSLKRIGCLILGNTAVLFLLLGLVEFGLYVLYAHAPKQGAWLRAAQQYFRGYESDVIQYNPACAVFDPTVTYTLRPGTSEFKTREFETTIHVNSMGCRDDEDSLNAPEVIFMGDSHAMGWGGEPGGVLPSTRGIGLGSKRVEHSHQLVWHGPAGHLFAAL